MKTDTNDFTVFSVQDSNYLFCSGTSKYFSISKCAKSLLSQYQENPDLTPKELSSRLMPHFSEEEIKKTQSDLSSLIEKGVFSTSSSQKPPSHARFSDITLKLVHTRRCNLNCSYCFNKKKSTDWDMDISTAKKAIHFFIDHFHKPNTRIIIDLSGAGEPLLRTDFIFELNDHLLYLKRRYGYDIFMQFASNGMLLRKKLSNKLKKNNILFGVSLDGGSLSSNKERNGLAFQTVLSNIMDVEDKTYFGIAATTTPENCNITEIFDSLLKLKAPSISIRPARLAPIADKESSDTHLQAYAHAYTDFCDHLLNNTLGGNLADLLVLLRGDDYFGRFLKLTRKSTHVFYRCSAGLNSIAVDGKGDIYICPALSDAPELQLGSIETGLSNEALYEHITHAYADNDGTCSKCWARYLCGGECHAVSWSAFHELTIPDPFMCELKKHLIRLSIHFWMKIASGNPNLFKDLQKRIDAL